MITQIIRFDIIDRHTRLIVGTCKTRAKATASVNRRDNAYGAYRFMAKPVYGVTETQIDQACDQGYVEWLYENLTPKA